LYYAKKHGRNQVQYYRNLVEQKAINGFNEAKVRGGDIDFF